MFLPFSLYPLPGHLVLMEVFSHLLTPPFICTHFCNTHSCFSQISLFLVSLMTPQFSSPARLNGYFSFLQQPNLQLPTTIHSFLTPPRTFLIPHTFSVHPIKRLKQISFLIHITFFTLTIFHSSFILSWYSSIFSFLFSSLTLRTHFASPTHLVFTHLITTLSFLSIRKWLEIPPASPLKTYTSNYHLITLLDTPLYHSYVCASFRYLETLSWPWLHYC